MGDPIGRNYQGKIEWDEGKLRRPEARIEKNSGIEDTLRTRAQNFFERTEGPDASSKFCGRMYIREFQRSKTRKNPLTAERRRSPCTRDGKDAIPALAKWCVEWDAYNKGLFIGGFGSGTSVHIDHP